MSQAAASTSNGSRKLYCARCRIHGLKTPTKNHKGKCWFRFCVCTPCTNIEESNKYQRMYVQRRRAGSQLNDEQESAQDEVTSDSQSNEDSDDAGDDGKK